MRQYESPNWSYWIRLRKWQVWEACYLALNVEPDHFPGKQGYPPPPDFGKLKRLVYDEMSHGHALGDSGVPLPETRGDEYRIYQLQVSPTSFVHWFTSLGYSFRCPIPVEEWSQPSEPPATTDAERTVEPKSKSGRRPIPDLTTYVKRVLEEYREECLGENGKPVARRIVEVMRFHRVKPDDFEIDASTGRWEKKITEALQILGEK